MFDGPVENADFRYIALGAGVQSSVMALMASRGEIEPMPNCAIFADTQWEPKYVYEHLDWLETQLSFPVYRVTRDNIREISLKSTRITNRELVDRNQPVVYAMPVFTDSDAGGIVQRQCTLKYKIEPLQQKVRALLGYAKGQSVGKGIMAEAWMGISRDEVHRVKDSRVGWITHRWPLIEERMSRFDCQLWFEKNYPNRPLAKSACIGCPYHSDRNWKEMKEKDETSWNDAVDFDHKLRQGPLRAFGLKNLSYLHRSMTPLDEVSFENETDRGQMDMFGEECEGMCGV